MEIDLKEFIVSVTALSERWSHENPDTYGCLNPVSDVLKAALENQGLWIKDGVVAKVSGNNTGNIRKFSIEKGKWYICVKSIYNSEGVKRFTEGHPYLSPKDEHLVRDDNGQPEIIGAFLVSSFRPATVEEISDIDIREDWIREILDADTTYQMSMNDEMAQEAKKKAVEALSKLSIGKLLGFGSSAIEDTPHSPKFKKGDWIVSSGTGYIYHIVDIKNGEYIIRDENNVYVLNFQDIVESKCRLWTIQDAKDGDVLVYDARWIILFDKVIDEDTLKYHALYNTETAKTIINDSAILDRDALSPATQEQKRLLFDEIKKAGYEWNTENKELRKIEPTTAVSNDVSETEELTEFEEKLASLIYSVKNSTIAPYKVENVAKSEAKELLSVAHKQIASEIEQKVNNMVEEALDSHWINTMDRHIIYKQGIEDVLTKIKDE